MTTTAKKSEENCSHSHSSRALGVKTWSNASTLHPILCPIKAPTTREDHLGVKEKCPKVIGQAHVLQRTRRHGDLVRLFSIALTR